MTLALRLALRDLRGGLGPLRLLLACLALGVAALAGVGSLAAAIEGGLSAGGRAILGGDVEMRVSQRLADPAERAAFARAGTLSETVRLRAMARTPDGRDAALVELKGVDAAYPLYGTLEIAPGGRRPGAGEAAIAPALAARLGLAVGDRVAVGEARLRIAGLIAAEPDRLGEGFAVGPVMLVDMGTLRRTGLVRPGSLYAARYRLKLPDGADVARAGDALVSAFPSGGWEAKDRTNAAPSLRRFVDRLGQFLTLLGLAALAVAGIGVGNGVASWADARRPAIATLKALGASSALIFRAYLAQVAIVAVIGIALGLAIGAAVPPLAGALVGEALPVPAGIALYPAPLAVAAGYGLLIALLFALAPLARARGVTAAALFRGGIEPAGRTGWAVRAGQAGLAAAIVALALATAGNRMLAVWFLIGAGGLIALLAAIGRALRLLAARLPRPRRPLARLALANLHRPAAPTGRLVVALGLGLSLFATLAVVETSLGAALRSSIPARAPSFFALDLQQADVAPFVATVRRAAPGADIATVPLLRGQVVAIGGRRVADMKAVPEGAWILRGDRGLTYTPELPAGNTVVAGRWWPAGYAGPPLVSLDVAAADALGLKVGDPITVSVLGVEIAARIANLRRIEWERMGFNFAILFAPGALEGAPHAFAATVSAPGREDAIGRAVATRFPAVSMIRVSDVIGQVSGVLGQMAQAVRAAGAVALLAGVAVLIGAVAASRRQRSYDAVLLKLLGATRGQVLAAQAMEFAGLAVVLALIAGGAGALAGRALLVNLLGLPFAPDWGVVVATLAGGGAAIVAIGLAVAWPALAARPAQALRSL